MIDPFVTAIADIRGLVQPVAAFLYEIFTGLIAGWAGGTFNITENDFVAGIGFTTVIAMNAKVMGIIECSLVIPVTQSM
jgi:hypothetical protein